MPHSRPDPYAGFACALETVSDAPEPLRSGMQAALSSDDEIRLLILSPAIQTSSQKLPASLLAISDTGWILVKCRSASDCDTIRSTFRDTLLIEWTRILLSGRLKIVFIGHEGPEATEIECNAVMARLYQRAIRNLLDGIDAIDELPPGPEEFDHELRARLKTIPPRFANAILSNRPASRRILDLVHWNPVLRARLGFQQEVLPEGLLLRTSRELIWISDDTDQPRHGVKHGYVITYCSLSRFKEFQICRRNEMGLLQMILSGSDAYVEVGVTFPCEREDEVRRFMSRFDIGASSGNRDPIVGRQEQ